MADFGAKKRQFFFCFFFRKKMFCGKCIQFQENGPIGVKIGRGVPKDPSYNFGCQIFYIWLFSNFIAAEVRREGDFWVKLPIFCKKLPARRISRKSQISKICCRRLQLVPVGTFLPICRPIQAFPQNKFNFPSTIFFQIFAESAKKRGFFARKSGNFWRKFPKFWKSIKTT